MLDKKIVHIINYIYLFLAINYGIMVNQYIHFDASNYFLCIFSLLVLAVNGKSILEYLRGKPALFWTIICFYSIFNYLFHPHPYEEIPLIYLFKYTIVNWVVFGVSIREFLDDESKLLKVIVVVLVLNIIMVLSSQSLYSREEGNLFDNVNTFAILISFLSLYLALLNKSGNLKLLYVILLFVVLAYMLSMLGCRKAFYGMIIIVVFWALSSFNIRKLRTLIFLGAFFVLAIWGYGYIMENSFVGKRMEMEKDMDYLPPGAPEWMSVLGDRAPMYYYAPEKFMDAPLFGVGLRQAQFFNGYVHSEFLAQLLDNGIVGFVFLILFYFGIGKGLLKGAKYHDERNMCMLGAFISLMLVSITAWTWQFSYYFILFGIFVGYRLQQDYRIIEDSSL